NSGGLHTRLRAATRRIIFQFGLITLSGILLSVAAPALAQQTNPVDRKVTNPMTDTPNVNPLVQDQPVRPRLPPRRGAQGEATEDLKIDAGTQTVSGPPNAQVFVYEGNVDARIGTYRLQADKVTVYEATNKVVAEGNVVFDQSDQQRITGSRAEWNYRTKTGFFVDSTGFTNQTEDGTRIYFTADRVEKISLDTIVATNAQVTACDEDVPKWSFHASRVKIKTGDRVRAYSPTMRIKGVPMLYLPYTSISIKRRDRASGFLTPTFGGSGAKGARFSGAYYKTLGRSADATFRTDIYTSRGIGIGADVRTRANSRSYLNFGFYSVKDRILGSKADATHPDQGGSSFYVEGVHYFPNGFIAAADVNITSNLAYRQVFSDNIQQAISPEERSQVFVNKNHGSYSFNFLARTQVTSLPTSRIRIRELPSISIEKRPGLLSFLKRLPVYFSFEGTAGGMSRKETVEDLIAFRAEVGGEPIISPSLVQRLDFHPRVQVPLTFAGFNITASASSRVTFYSNQLDPTTRSVLSQNLTRGYGEFELDFRPPAFARDFHRGDAFFFRHVIEPYIIYRRIYGINEFDRLIRFDYNDAIANTNEIEFGISNRFFTRRSTENVSSAAARAASRGELTPLSSQPYEALTITIRGKYFFDPFFGGALLPGQRNQFYPINTLSGFSYGGFPRRFSPINIEARYRPSNNIFVDLRTDLDTRDGGLRAISTTFGINRPLVQAFQSFYYTRAIALVGDLSRFGDANGNEPGTQRGSQWSPSIFLGNRERGLFGGASFFFDFQKRPGRGTDSLISSTVTLGYTWDCCAVTVQNYTFDVGLRKENRFVFSFRLNGIGTFGTEQIGQNFR
ncbi:MAG TPA: LPS assembly protein LptD, partial [Pyrinomonadaceae bacterium]|nr:LPS assembly protein LptD [Pyrinomonadaceae bacterium]